MDQTTQQGIAALKRGDKVRARQLLIEAAKQNPDNVQAWLWLSGAVETDRERVHCLQQVLRLNPDNQAAAKGLARLVASGAVSLQAKSAEAKSVPPPAMPRRQAAATRLASTPQSARGGTKQDAIIFTARPSLIPLFTAGFLIVLIFGALWGLIMSLFPAGETGSLIRGLFTVILLLYAVGMGLRWVVALIRRLVSRYTLTSRRLIVQNGILSRSRKTIPIRRIQDVTYHQRLLDRPFNIGDVIVESAGERGAVRLISLPRCQEYAETVLEVVHRSG